VFDLGVCEKPIATNLIGQPRVLVLEHLQLARLAHIYAAILRLPRVERGVQCRLHASLQIFSPLVPRADGWAIDVGTCDDHLEPRVARWNSAKPVLTDHDSEQIGHARAEVMEIGLPEIIARLEASLRARTAAYASAALDKVERLDRGLALLTNELTRRTSGDLRAPVALPEQAEPTEPARTAGPGAMPWPVRQPSNGHSM
jgi:hypothetical protein